MNVGRKYYFIIIGLFLLSFDAFGQVPEGYLREVEFMDTGDTVTTHRYHGDWWFGVFAGPNVNLFFGDLFSRENPQIGDATFNRKISFNSTFGGGFYFGGIAEYRPRLQHWGFTLGITFLDRKLFSTMSDKMPDSLATQFEYKSTLDYLIISPGAKYYLSSISGMYYFSSMDIGINTGALSRQRRRFENSGTIEQFLRIPDIKANTRFEFNLGVGYEFLLADFAKKGRIIGNPYVSLNAGSNVITNLKSSWNTVGFKLGFAMKFGKDYRYKDTLQFNPIYEPPVEFIAQVVPDIEGVEFPGFTPSSPMPPVWLAMVEEPEIDEELAMLEAARFNEELRQREQGQIRRRISPNQMSVYTFERTETTNLSREIEEYLDLLSEYYKGNQNVEIRITGHSDNQGTLQQNTQRASTRANNVRAYLIRKGVPANRILVTSRGALIPVAPNDTPANQRRNRRVEIIVVPR